MSTNRKGQELRDNFAKTIKTAQEQGRLPLSIEVDYGNAIVYYVQNKDEYRGIIRRKTDGKTCDVTHYITFDGWVGPAVSTNKCAQRDPFVKENIPSDKYWKVIFNLLDVAKATIEEMLSKELSQIEEHLKLPKWLKVIKGEMSEDDTRRATLAGVGLHMLDFAETCGCRIIVDTIALIQRPSIVQPRYICVEKGEWDNNSQLQAKNVDLPAGYRALAIEDGLRLSSVKRTRKESGNDQKSKSKQKSRKLEGEELHIEIQKLKEKFHPSEYGVKKMLAK